MTFIGVEGPKPGGLKSRSETPRHVVIDTPELTDLMIPADEVYIESRLDGSPAHSGLPLRRGMWGAAP
jgi:hypothetical protein